MMADGEHIPASLVIRNEIFELRKLPQFLEAVFKECRLDDKERIRIRSGLDEALTNCVMYAYEVPGEGKIELLASLDSGRLYFILKDAGKPFNPLEYCASQPAELTVGGLGISMYKAIFDEIEYSREDGHNILKLIKSL